MKNKLDQNIHTYNQPWSVQEYSKDDQLTPVEERLILRHFPKPPAKILDLGCGAGRTTKALVQMGYDVVAIDLSSQLLEAAKESCPKAVFKLMNATKLRFKDETFDAVLFSSNGMGCIYPSVERFKVFDEVGRVLAKKGVFLYTGHNLLGRFFRSFPLRPRYWVNLFKFTIRQLKNKQILEGYCFYQDPSGIQLLYYGSPHEHIKAIFKKGFNLLSIQGCKRYQDNESLSLEPYTKDQGLLRLTFFYHHIYYTLQKK